MSNTRTSIRPAPAARIAPTLAACVALMLLVCVPGHASLSARLQRGETVTIVALGDSLATGYELANPDRDAYPLVFRTVLQRRYPRARVRLVNSGIPGDTAEGGAARVARDVIAHDPDLVLIQFGGNDHGRQRDPADFQRNLHEIIAEIRAATHAEMILATNPIIAPDTDTPMVLGVKTVARATGLPLADFDGDIRRHDTGPRGPFPCGRHPRADLHAVMARSLYGAFTRLLREPEPLRVHITQGVRTVAHGAGVPVEVRAQALDPGLVTLSLEYGEVRQEQQVIVAEDGQASATFLLPPLPEGTRMSQERLLAWAHRGDAFAYDLCFLTLTPVIAPGSGPVALGKECLVLGAERWRGEEDLSGTLQVDQEGGEMVFRVEVRDDRIERNRRRSEPYDRDAVEMFFDLRAAQSQGKSTWEPDVVAFFCSPDAKEPAVRLTPLEPFPPGWQPSSVRWEKRPMGYRMETRIPLALLAAQMTPGQETIGFDVALDDADSTAGRKCQMMWAGGADDFLDPSLLGALSLRPATDGKPRVRVCIR